LPNHSGFKVKVKSVGQECPTHTSTRQPFSTEKFASM
jgi:hypothetical protein